MRKIPFYILSAACLLSGPLHAQFDKALDAKKREILSELPSDFARIDTLNEWAFQNKGEISERYAEAALELERQQPYPKGRADSYMRLSYAVETQEKMMYYVRLAIQVRTSLNDWPGVANCYNRLGLWYKNQARFDSAAAMFQAGLELVRDQPLHESTASLHNNLGNTYRAKNFYEKAYQQYSASIQLYEKLIEQSNLDDPKRKDLRDGLARARLNVGEFLQECRNQYASAKDSLLKSLADFEEFGLVEDRALLWLLLGNNAYYEDDLKEAESYYQRGIAAKASIHSSLYLKLAQNLGRVYLDWGKYKKAGPLLEESLHGFISQENTYEEAHARFQLGCLYYEQGRFDSAAHHYQLAVKKSADDFLLKGRALYFLIDALDQSGRTEEAEAFSQQYVGLFDELDEEDTRDVFKELFSYQLERNRLISRIEREEHLKQQQLWLGVFFLLGFLLLLAWMQARVNLHSRKAAERKAEVAQKIAELAEGNEEIARKNEALAIQEKLELIKSKELEAAYAKIEGQDEAQRRIGQELHDSVGVMLSTVKLNLLPVDEVLDILPSEKRQQYRSANNMLDEACEEVRRISHQLSSAVLTKFGLKAQLEALGEAISSSGQLQVELNTYGLQERLDAKTELQIYRIVQELVNNTIKHARATNISIQVNRFEHGINTIVEDDGCGFDAGAVRNKPGLGIQGLTARVHQLDGEILFDSRAGRGTIVSIDVPLAVPS